MDTDDLTPMAYDCLLRANNAVDILMIELGALCSGCKTEDECLMKMLEHVKVVRRFSNDYLDAWNLLDDIKVSIFRKNVVEVEKFIEKTLATPIKERKKWKHKKKNIVFIFPG